MAGKDGILHVDSPFGKVATHPARETQPLVVAPTTDDLFNTLGLDLIPVACLSLHDILFEFDSSFLNESVTNILQELPGLRESHKSKTTGELPPLSIFGHADPVGEDEYNKQLSGRRATAIFALLTRDVKKWEFLLDHPLPFGGDNWRGTHVVAKMRKSVGASPKTESDLIAAYMQKLCPFQLTPEDFLGRGADAGGKADFQGCGEFNPQVLLSIQENNTLPAKKRNDENQPNRRVVVFLFRAGTKVAAALWPCPRANEPTPGCRARFFGPPKTGDERRKAGAVRREHIEAPDVDQDEPDDTFACRFYVRISHLSPCEGRIVPVLRILNVHLKLVYKDPEGNERVLPPDLPVTVEFSKGDTQAEKVGKDGILSFEIDRDKKHFTLRFDAPQAQFVASATAETKGPGPERLIAEAGVDAAVADHYRVFKLPPKWSLADSDWKVESTVFSDKAHEFQKLDDATVTLGSDTAPVKMTLDPHWQFLRFVYFDRTLKKRLSIPPVMVEGFLKAPAGGASPDKSAADTRSNWTVQPDAARQCLPWIVRVPPKPDKDVLLQFRTDANTFIETAKDGTRKLATGAKHDTPNAGRLRFYDLPPLWKSSHYFARFTDQSGPVDGDDVFEKVAGKPTDLSKPVFFSLDDIVLTDDKIQPIAWTPGDRVALFRNDFSNLESDDQRSLDFSDIGLFHPDAANKRQFFTEKPKKFETSRNYIADYPDWTRLLVALGNLFDVFDQRTSSGPVIGARAAVRWVEAAGKLPPGDAAAHNKDRPEPVEKPFFTLQRDYVQRHDDPTVSVQDRLAGKDKDRGIGCYDMALLRCCDADGEIEVAVNFQYARCHFDFTPAPGAGQKPLDPPLRTDPTAQRNWIDASLRLLDARWNETDNFGLGRQRLLPQDPAPASHKLRVDLSWFTQSVPRAISHVSFGVFKTAGRDSVNPDTLLGAVEDELNATGNLKDGRGNFVFAHEMGHVGSLGDEYIENRITASYRRNSFFSRQPGSPYAIDSGALMSENLAPTTRYLWHAAEWLHTLKSLGFPFLATPHKVQGNQPAPDNKFVFKLLHHPKFDKHFTFVNFPLARKLQGTVAGKGHFDLFLYPLGDEPFNRTGLPTLVDDAHRENRGKFDGILVVIVKLKIKFFKPEHKLILASLDDLDQAVAGRFRGAFFATGTAAGVEFKNVYITFSPRYLVEDFSGDKSLEEDMGIKTKEEYKTRVDQVEAMFGTDCRISVEEKGQSRWDVRPQPPGPGQPAPLGRLILSREQKWSDVFPPFFWDMLGLTDPGSDLAKGAQQLEQIVTQVIPGGKAGFFKAAGP